MRNILQVLQRLGRDEEGIAVLEQAAGLLGRWARAAAGVMVVPPPGW